MTDRHRIADVLAILKPQSPESLSKIRFLEHTGRISTVRAADGYLRCSAEEVAAVVPSDRW